MEFTKDIISQLQRSGCYTERLQCKGGVDASPGILSLACGLQWRICDDYRLAGQWVNAIGQVVIISLCPHDGALRLSLVCDYRTEARVLQCRFKDGVQVDQASLKTYYCPPVWMCGVPILLGLLSPSQCISNLIPPSVDRKAF